MTDNDARDHDTIREHLVELRDLLFDPFGIPDVIYLTGFMGGMGVVLAVAAFVAWLGKPSPTLLEGLFGIAVYLGSIHIYLRMLRGEE